MTLAPVRWSPSPQNVLPDTQWLFPVCQLSFFSCFFKFGSLYSGFNSLIMMFQNKASWCLSCLAFFEHTELHIYISLNLAIIFFKFCFSCLVFPLLSLWGSCYMYIRPFDTILLGLRSFVHLKNPFFLIFCIISVDLTYPFLCHCHAALESIW